VGHFVLYTEGYEPIDPFHLGYLLSFIQRYGGREREVSFFSDRLLEFFPDFLDRYSERYRSEEVAKQAFSGYLCNRIFSRLLAELGLVETREVKGSTYSDNKYLIRRTELFDQVFAVW
jgi:hypothetical protein